jgi:hypothetical protein
MKTQTYMKVRMYSFLVAAAIPTLAVVAAAQQFEDKQIADNQTREEGPTSRSPCGALEYIALNRNAQVAVTDVAPSRKTGCR